VIESGFPTPTALHEGSGLLRDTRRPDPRQLSRQRRSLRARQSADLLDDRDEPTHLRVPSRQLVIAATDQGAAMPSRSLMNLEAGPAWAITTRRRALVMAT